MKKFKRSIVACIISLATTTSFAEGTTSIGSPSITTPKAEQPLTTTPAPRNVFADLFVGSVTGNFDLTSNYIFRGVSNSNNTPAVQGGMTYQVEQTGMYLNFWGSNVNFQDTTATVEIDTVAGIRNPITDNIDYDVSFARYNYPKAGDLNYNEVIGVLNVYFLTGTIGYSPNVYNTHGSGTYYNLGANFDIPSKYVYFENVNIAGGVGHYDLPRAAGNSYDDYSVTLSKAIKNYTLSVAWTDTNHKYSNNSLDHSHIIGTVTVDF